MRMSKAINHMVASKVSSHGFIVHSMWKYKKTQHPWLATMTLYKTHLYEWESCVSYLMTKDGIIVH